MRLCSPRRKYDALLTLNLAERCPHRMPRYFRANRRTRSECARIVLSSRCVKPRVDTTEARSAHVGSCIAVLGGDTTSALEIDFRRPLLSPARSRAAPRVCGAWRAAAGASRDIAFERILYIVSLVGARPSWMGVGKRPRHQPTTAKLYAPH